MRSTSSLFGGADASFVPTWGDFAGGLSKNPPGRKASSILCFEYAKPSAYWFISWTQVTWSNLASVKGEVWKSLTFTITSASNLPFDRDMSCNVAAALLRLPSLETSAKSEIEKRDWNNYILPTGSYNIYYIRRVTAGRPLRLYTKKKKRKRWGRNIEIGVLNLEFRSDFYRCLHLLNLNLLDVMNATIFVLFRWMNIFNYSIVLASAFFESSLMLLEIWTMIPW